MTEPLGPDPAVSFLASLGARGSRRAEPRASIAIAGAGCALAVLGVLIVAGDTGASDGDFNRVPGLVLSALVVAAGVFTLHTVRDGAIATAGAAAAALGVPPFVFFLTFNQSQFPPYSTEGILLVSTVAWLAAYAIGPGRGRPFFLGAGLLGAWFTLLQLTEQVFEAPFGFFGVMTTIGEGSDSGFDSGFDGGSGGPSFDVPDPTTLGAISLVLGAGYLVLSRRLDRTGYHGTATPFALAALPTLLFSIVFLGDDLEAAGSGLLGVLVGLALVTHGASVLRRATAWIGAATTATGAAVFLTDMTDDATVGGMLFLAAGIALVAAGHAAGSALHEADEMSVTAAIAAPVDEPTVWAPPPMDPPRPADPPAPPPPF